MKKKAKDTYKRIRLSPNETRDRHRLLKEKQLGRRLKRNEVVHHLIPGKDKPIFTKVIPLSEHSRIHMLKLWKENGEQMTKNLRKKLSGENGPAAKLNWEKVYKIRKLYRKGIYDRFELAKIYNVSEKTIRSVIKRQSWKRPYLYKRKEINNES